MKGFPEHFNSSNLTQHWRQCQFRLEMDGCARSGWLTWPEMQALVSRVFAEPKVKIHYGPWQESYSFARGREFYRSVLDGFEHVACVCATYREPDPEPREAACFAYSSAA